MSFEPRETKKKTRTRRIARRVLQVAVAAAALVLVAALGLRLYLSDARLRDLARAELASALGVEVRLEELRFSLLHGIELTGLGLSPPEGFTHPPLKAERLALRWSLFELLRLRVVIDEVAVEGLHLVLEENERGRALDAMLPKKAPSKPAPPAPRAAEKPAPAESASFKGLSLPLRVIIHRIAITKLQAELKTPGLSAHLDELNLEGSFDGLGEALALDLWLGLGERAAGGAPSRIALTRAEPRLALEAFTRLGIHITSTSLRDLTVKLGLENHARVSAPYDLPPIDATLEAALALDLFAQTAELAPCVFTLGQNTLLELGATLSEVLSHKLALALTTTRLQVDLDELAAFVAAVMPGTTIGGKLELELAPLKVTLGNPRGDLPAAHLRLRFTRVAAATARQRVAGLDGELTLKTEGDEAHLALALDVARLADAQNDVRGLTLQLDVTTPLALVFTGSAAEPLRASLRLSFEDLTAASAALARMTLTMDAAAWDLAAARAETKLALTIGGATLKDGILIPKVEVALDARRERDDFDIRHLNVNITDLAELSLKGGLGALTTEAPRFRALELALTLPALERVLALAPSKTRPPQEIEGALTLYVKADGVIDRGALLARARPPAIDPITDQASWRRAVMSYTEYMQAFAAWLERGMPFTASTRLVLKQIALRDEKNEISGLDLDTTLDLLRHGPKLHLTLAIDRIARPVEARGIALDLKLTTNAYDTIFGMTAKVDSLAHGALPAPLEDLRCEAGARYRLGGDLALDRMKLTERGQGLRFAASGVVARPLSVALERGFERAGAPGLDAAFRVDVGYGRADGVVQKDGLELKGLIDLGASVRMSEGKLALMGKLAADAFSYAAGATRVEDLSGEFPFALELFAGRHDEGVVIARELGFGGGVLSLLVAGDEGRRDAVRPAYYQRLRSYRAERGLRARLIKSGAIQLADFRLDGGLDAGRFFADEIGMRVLGGDISGNLAFALTRDAALRGALAFAVSGIDASNFELLHLAPGPDSELNADLTLGFLFANRQRDLSMTMNVTKIGADTLDRFLQLLDPSGKDKNLQSTRDNLALVRINAMAIWVRYENLNMDLSYSTKLRIPFTDIGYHPIPRELLRRYSLSELLDASLQPSIDAFLAKPLGWTNER